MNLSTSSSLLGQTNSVNLMWPCFMSRDCSGCGDRSTREAGFLLIDAHFNDDGNYIYIYINAIWMELVLRLYIDWAFVAGTTSGASMPMNVPARRMGAQMAGSTGLRFGMFQTGRSCLLVRVGSGRASPAMRTLTRWVYLYPTYAIIQA